VSGFDLSLSKGITHIVCSVPSVNLVEGEFSLDIKVYSGYESILFAQDFFQFRIQPANIYKSGKLPDPSWGGVCHLHQIWKAVGDPH
jgi:hypothetical protein